MVEEVKMSEVMDEIKNASEDELRNVITDWYEKIHTQSMRLGAKYMAAGIFGAIQNHLNKKAKISLRDYERCIKDIRKIITVQLTMQDDSEANEVVEEVANDGTAE